MANELFETIAGKIEESDIRLQWTKNGELHCLKGPALTTNSGDRFWLQNGKLHRTDGPAVELANGIREYFINNVKYSSSKSFQAAASLTESDMFSLHSNYGIVE